MTILPRRRTEKFVHGRTRVREQRNAEDDDGDRGRPPKKKKNAEEEGMNQTYMRRCSLPSLLIAILPSFFDYAGLLASIAPFSLHASRTCHGRYNKIYILAVAAKAYRARAPVCNAFLLLLSFASLLFRLALFSHHQRRQSVRTVRVRSVVCFASLVPFLRTRFFLCTRTKDHRPYVRAFMARSLDVEVLAGNNGGGGARACIMRGARARVFA